MKTESLNELRQAVERLTYTANDLSNAKEDILKAMDHIRAALYMETPAPSGRFKLEEFLADDPIRPAMCGVFHDGGYKVGCDSHILAACKESYEPEKEGKIIGKDGREIVGVYPKWRSVVPTSCYKGEDDPLVTEIDTAKVYDLLRQEKAENKLVGKNGPAQVAIVRVGDAYFKASFLAKVCKFMDHYGIKRLRTYGPRRAAKATAEDGSVSIIMPVVSTLLPYNNGCYRTSMDTEIWKAWDDESFTFLRLAF